MMLEPTAPAPTCRTRPKIGRTCWAVAAAHAVVALDWSVCRQVFHRISSGPPEARSHAFRNTLPTPRATANKRTDVTGSVRHGEDRAACGNRHPAICPGCYFGSLDAGPGPMAKRWLPVSRGSPIER